MRGSENEDITTCFPSSVSFRAVCHAELVSELFYMRSLLQSCVPWGVSSELCYVGSTFCAVLCGELALSCVMWGVSSELCYVRS